MNNTIVNLPHTRQLIAKNNHSCRKLPQKVAIIYTDEKREYFYTEEEFWTVEGSEDEAREFQPYFDQLNIQTCYLKGDSNLVKNLRHEKPDMALNLVTTVKGYDYLGATIPATLELLEIPYTGAAILGFSLGCNKYLIYALLSQHGIPVPRFQLLTSTKSTIDPSLRYPLILKLNEEHSNVEIKRESIAENETQLRKRLRYLINKYEQDVLVSEFIDGREFGAFVFQSYNKKAYTIERKIHLPNNNSRHEFLDYDIVWGNDYDNYKKYVHYEKFHDPLLNAYVKKAFNIIKMDDYGKFDIRMDSLGNYYFIDANANCHFAPLTGSSSELSIAMKMYGISFKTLLKRLLQNTMREWGY
ncbi:hypothetical protein HYV64_04915 [Candidatus Shapirobacteria bacterium]|nr:hypothetical protein [Candidatus Shapirobacteria bacterium]